MAEVANFFWMSSCTVRALTSVTSIRSPGCVTPRQGFHHPGPWFGQAPGETAISTLDVFAVPVQSRRQQTSTPILESLVGVSSATIRQNGTAIEMLSSGSSRSARAGGVVQSAWTILPLPSAASFMR